MPDGTQAVDTASGASAGFAAGGAEGAELSEDQVLGFGTETTSTEEPKEATQTDDAQAPPVDAQQQQTDQPPTDKPATEQLEPGVIPAELKHLMSDPKVGPRIQALVDQNGAFRQSFATVREAREYKEAFPTLEEAKAASAKALALDEADDKFYGTPEEQSSLAEEWIRDNPQAFRSMFVQSAATLQKNDPQGYEQITDSVFQGRLQAAEWPEQFAAIRQALQAGDLDRLKGLAGWLVQDAEKRGIRWESQTGKVPPEKQALDRDRQAVETERASVRTEKIEFFNNQVTGHVETNLKQSINGTLASLLKDTAFSDKGKAAIATEIYKQVEQRISADNSYKRSMRDIVSPGGKLNLTKEALTAARNLALTRAKALIPTVAKQVIAERTAEFIAQNDAINSKRNTAGARKEVGTAGAAGIVRTLKLTPKDVESMTDGQIMDA